jgi:four helix bundle protein
MSDAQGAKQAVERAKSEGEEREEQSVAPDPLPLAPGSLPQSDSSPLALSPLPSLPHRRPHWRFEDLEIWQLARELAVKFHRVADRLNDRRLYRYAEQLRAAGLSLSNNIAEGSGSTHKREFMQFLNIARRSLFEDASMLLVFETLGLFESEEINGLLTDCDALSRKITNFSRTLSS